MGQLGWFWTGAKRVLRVAAVLSALGLGRAGGATALTNGVVTLPGTNAAAAAAAALRDIRGPVEIPSGWAWVWRTLFALAIAALGWWAWHVWQKRRKEGPVEAAVPPAQTARERLREALWLINQPQPFCFAITEIVRAYLEQQFGLRAPERTTEEFLGELQQSLALDQRHKGALEDFLLRCDLVKFARLEPAQAELEELHAAAVRLVDETAGWMPPRRPPDQVSTEAPLAMGVRSLPVEDSTLTGDARYMPRDRAAVDAERAGEESAR